MAQLFILIVLVTSAILASRSNPHQDLAAAFFILALLALLHTQNRLSHLDWPLWLFTILAIVLLLIQHWFSDRAGHTHHE
ncbi:hypothetical protein [Schleiferilactobacillus shenzhenensis]|uniref:Uncharacterized protein n=1 Tax=Schleiferilactobacillus shenzhenensis LY-73 TaxID=1231336 RepID=U4TW22_9LACO|nr:hypothetical protein [Schleiferilactobacillus shenzhenensis]ERL65587.1 hypothetical protein L248_2660 [Schleiferilactobacillus shenzhenensis LY-73]